MKHRYIILLITFFSVVLSQAAVVKGRVVDAATGAGIDFVNVALLPADKNQSTLGGMTDANGIFSIEYVPIGKYELNVSYIGYKPYTKNITIQTISDEVKLGKIALQEDAQLLSEVEVVGQASQMRFDIDKKVFNVDQNLAAAGASVTEVLENIPSVEVDQEGKISLRNNSSVTIWINGKPAGLTEDNQSQILEQMPAGSVQSVEIITNPSAKYDPEGTVGIINLVLKKDRKAGYYGSVMAGGNYAIYSLPGAQMGFNFNYNSKVVDFYINLGGRYMNDHNTSITDRYTFAPGSNRLDTLTFLGNSGGGLRSGFGMFGRAGADFHIDDKNTIALSFMGFGGLFNSKNDNYYTSYSFEDNELLHYSRNVNNKSKHPSFHVGLDYIYEIDDKGSDFRVGVEYGYHNRTGDHNYVQKSIVGDVYEYTQIQRQDSYNQSVRFKGDYTQKIGDNMKVEAGAYASWQQRQSPSRTWDMEGNDSVLKQFNDFNYEEWIAALYATYGAKFGGFSFSLGLRGEYTNTKVMTREAEDADWQTTTRDHFPFYSNQNYTLFQLYPTLFLSYSFPKNHELQVNYTRRINRPRGRQLNVFRDASDSTNIRFGNPLIDPEFSSAVELNYIKTWDDHAITASLFYRYTDDVIQEVRYLGEDNVMYSTYENIAKRQSAGAEFVAKNKLAKWCNLTTTISGFYAGMNDVYYDTDGDGEEELLYKRQNSFSWNIRLMANFIMPQNWSAQLTGQYRSAEVVAQGKRNQSYILDLGIRKSFLNRKLNLSFTVRDILYSRKWANTTWGDNFWQYSEFKPHGTQFNLSLTYNFGNAGMQKRKPQQDGMNMMDSDSMGYDY